MTVQSNQSLPTELARYGILYLTMWREGETRAQLLVGSQSSALTAIALLTYTGPVVGGEWTVEHITLVPRPPVEVAGDRAEWYSPANRSDCPWMDWLGAFSLIMKAQFQVDGMLLHEIGLSDRCLFEMVEYLTAAQPTPTAEAPNATP